MGADIILARYQPREPGGGMNALAAAALLPPVFGFLQPKQALEQVFSTQQLFFVATGGTLFEGRDPARPDDPPAIFANLLDIGDWRFRANPGGGSTATAFENVLIVKYSVGSPLLALAADPASWPGGAALPPEADAVSAWLETYLRDAVETDQEDEAYDFFVQNVVTDPHWTGWVVLNATMPPAQALPPQIASLAPAIDPGAFRAHHFGALWNRISGSSAPTVSTFGLVDYRSAGIGGGPAQGPRMRSLRALFAHARLTSFSAELDWPDGRVQKGFAEAVGGRMTYRFQDAPATD